MPPLNVGLIGYGFSTKCFHLPFILPNSDLNVYAFLQRKDAPADPASAESGSHCTVDYPDAKHYQKADDFFADPAIDLVIVCSHTDTHASFAEQALRAGKNVVVEKPFTRDTAEADRLIEIAKEQKKLLTCFQNRRWDGDFLTLKHILSHKALGTLTEFENHYDMETPTWIQGWTAKEYSPGEGMLFGLGSHTMDQVLHLFGRPLRVSAFLRSLRGVESEIDDSFTVVLEYDGEQKNLLVTVKTTIVSPMQSQLKNFVRGTEGTWIKYGTCAQEEHAIQGMSATDPSFGVEDKSLYGTLTTLSEFDGTFQTYDEASKKYVGRMPTITGKYTGFYENVVDAIRGRGELNVKPEDSRDGIRLIELCRESNARHAAVEWS